MFNQASFTLTPWVRRLLVANAVVYLLTITVFTGRWFFELFAFSPALALTQPWTFVSYAFLHGGFFHLAFNMLLLFFFGPAVEDRLGSATFIKYYLACGIGGPVLTYLLVMLWPVNMVVGASGAVFGVSLAFAIFWPDTRIFLFPLPIPIKAKWLIIGLVTLDLIAQVSGANDGVAHLAHIGGFLVGLVYVRWLTASNPQGTEIVRPEPVKVLAHPTPSAVEHEEEPAPRARRERPSYEEVDRVLDKISATGLESLTLEERRLLDDMSRRLRDR